MTSPAATTEALVSAASVAQRRATAAINTALVESIAEYDGLESVLRVLRSEFGCAEASLMLYDADDDALVLQRPSFGIEDLDVLHDYRIAIADGGHSVGVFQTGETRLVNVTTDSDVMLQRHVEFLGLDNAVSARLSDGHRPIGVLHVLNRPGGFEPMHLDLLDLVAPLVSLWLAARRIGSGRRKNDRRVSELLRLHETLTGVVADRLGSDALTDLVAQHLAERRELGAIRVAVVTLEGQRPRGRAESDRFRRRLLSALEAFHRQGFAVPWRRQMVVVMPAGSADEDTTRARRLQQDLGDTVAGVGLSSVVDLDTVERGLAEARHAGEMVSRLPGAGPRCYEQLDLLRLLRTDAGGGLEGGPADFADEVLGPLLRHDAAQSADLVDTLRVWSTCDYSITDTAAALEVHRNTVKYRMRQIRELLGYDPSASPHRLRVELALQVESVRT